MKLVFYFVFLFATICLNAKEVKLSWEPSPQAIKYELEVKRISKLKSDVEVSQMLESLEWKGDLTYGTYVYRVRAIDKLLRPGEWSHFQKFLIKLPPIKIISPLEETPINSENIVTFEWEPVEGVSLYSFVLDGQRVETNQTKIVKKVNNLQSFEWSVSPVVEDSLPHQVVTQKTKFVDSSRNWNSHSQIKASILGGQYEYKDDFGNAGNGKIPSGTFYGVGAEASLWIHKYLGFSAGGKYRSLKVLGKNVALTDYDLNAKSSLLGALTKNIYIIPHIGYAQRQLSELTDKNSQFQTSGTSNSAGSGNLDSGSLATATLSANGASFGLELGFVVSEKWNFGLEYDYLKIFAINGIPRGGKANTSSSLSYRFGATTEYQLSHRWTTGAGVFYEFTRFEYLSASSQKSYIQSPATFLMLYSRFLIGN